MTEHREITVTEHRTNTSNAVVQALAAYEGVAGTELSPPLYDVIDPEALDALFQGERSVDAPTVSFTYNDCRVRITGPTAVEIHETT